MSSTETAARVLKSLKDEEWRTLAALERVSRGHGAGDTGRLSRGSRLPPERIQFAVGSLVRRGLATRRGQGYSLTREGVEAMALKDYVRKDLISALGAIIAKGKESDVYEVLTEEGTVYALKFYKIGRTSFTRVRKTRRIEESEIKSWMASNYEAAKREYIALRRLAGISPAFPGVVGYSRSTVLLQQVSGVRLSQRPELQDPEGSFTKVVEAMRLAYTKAGIVNGDLSEYNILTDGLEIWLIDWPQSVRTTDPSSPALIDHDVGAVVTFYRRAYGVVADKEGTLAFVKGDAKSFALA